MYTLLQSINEGMYGYNYFIVTDDIKQKITPTTDEQFNEIEDLAHAFGDHDPFEIRVGAVKVYCVQMPDYRAYKVPATWDINTLRQALPKLNIDPPGVS